MKLIISFCTSICWHLLDGDGMQHALLLALVSTESENNQAGASTKLTCTVSITTVPAQVLMTGPFTRAAVAMAHSGKMNLMGKVVGRADRSMACLVWPAGHHHQLCLPQSLPLLAQRQIALLGRA